MRFSNIQYIGSRWRVYRKKRVPPTSYTPTVAFDISWHPENNTVDVYHVGGDSLSPNDDEGTVGLFVTITDDNSGNTNRIT